MVPVVGLEPTRCCQQRILSPSRLPFHHTGQRKSVFIIACLRGKSKPISEKSLKSVLEREKRLQKRKKNYTFKVGCDTIIN